MLSEISADRNSDLKRRLFLLPPLLAFFGLALLLFFGGQNWMYLLPSYEPDVQLLLVDANPLHGQVQVPLAARLGAHLKVMGWLGPPAPAFQSQKIAVYLDARHVADTTMVESTLRGADGATTSIRNWQADFFLQDVPLGDHTLTVQSVLQGHNPVVVSQSPLSVNP